MLTPEHKENEGADEQVFYINQEIIDQIYGIYRDYANNFGPTLNSS